MAVLLSLWKCMYYLPRDSQVNIDKCEWRGLCPLGWVRCSGHYCVNIFPPCKCIHRSCSQSQWKYTNIGKPHKYFDRLNIKQRIPGWQITFGSVKVKKVSTGLPCLYNIMSHYGSNIIHGRMISYKLLSIFISFFPQGNEFYQQKIFQYGKTCVWLRSYPKQFSPVATVEIWDMLVQFSGEI